MLFSARDVQTDSLEIVGKTNKVIFHDQFKTVLDSKRVV